MSTKRTDQIGAQPDDPPWARFLFLLVQGRDGQWWRGLLLVALAGLLGVALVGALALAGWVDGALGVTAGVAALARRRRQANSGRRSGGH